MKEMKLTVHPFEMGEPKEAAVKVLEEAEEAYNAWDTYADSIAPDEEGPMPDYIVDGDRERFADEIADTIQAACNLAARYDLDIEAAMERCEQRNRERGRYE